MVWLCSSPLAFSYLLMCVNIDIVDTQTTVCTLWKAKWERAGKKRENVPMVTYCLFCLKSKLAMPLSRDCVFQGVYAGALFGNSISLLTQRVVGVRVMTQEDGTLKLALCPHKITGRKKKTDLEPLAFPVLLDHISAKYARRAMVSYCRGYAAPPPDSSHSRPSYVAS